MKRESVEAVEAAYEAVRPDRNLALDLACEAFYDAYIQSLFKQGVGKKQERFEDLPKYEQEAYSSALFYAMDFLIIDIDRRDLAPYEVRRQLRERIKT